MGSDGTYTAHVARVGDRNGAKHHVISDDSGTINDSKSWRRFGGKAFPFISTGHVDVFNNSVNTKRSP